MKTYIPALLFVAALSGFSIDAASAKSFESGLQAAATQSQTTPVAVDDGTGYWGPGSATGGPSGGLPNKN